MNIGYVAKIIIKNNIYYYKGIIDTDFINSLEDLISKEENINKNDIYNIKYFEEKYFNLSSSLLYTKGYDSYTELIKIYLLSTVNERYDSKEIFKEYLENS